MDRNGGGAAHQRTLWYTPIASYPGLHHVTSSTARFLVYWASINLFVKIEVNYSKSHKDLE
jgi:hypothetical protein